MIELFSKRTSIPKTYDEEIKLAYMCCHAEYIAEYIRISDKYYPKQKLVLDHVINSCFDKVKLSNEDINELKYLANAWLKIKHYKEIIKDEPLEISDLLD